MSRKSGRRALFAALALMASPWIPPIAAQRVPLVLDHLSIVLDSATYRDVQASPFIHEQFAAIDTLRVLSNDPASGMHLFGKYNYLVLAGPGRGGKARAGDVTIALGTEAAGGLAIMARFATFKEFGATPIDSAPGASMRHPWAWFDGLVLTGLDSTGVQFSIQQPSKAVASQLSKIDSQPATKLASYRFLAGSFDPSRLFSYLTGATLAIPVDDIARIVRMLRRDSVTVYDEGEGAIIRLSGFTLHLVPPWTGSGVKQLQFALTRDVLANPIYSFGPRSRLRFGPGPIATWDFDGK